MLRRPVEVKEEHATVFLGGPANEALHVARQDLEIRLGDEQDEPDVEDVINSRPAYDRTVQCFPLKKE